MNAVTPWSLCLAQGGVVVPERFWSAWSLAPAVVLPLALLAGWYVWVLAREASAMQRNLFAMGYALLLLALVSPLCRLAATLVSAHMVQHVLLVALAPPLLVLGMQAGAWTIRFARIPLAIWAPLYGGAIWLWHVPVLYQAALVDPAAHLLMLGSLVAISVGFWNGVLVGGRVGASLAVLLVTLMHTGMLGALLTFAPRPWYPLLASGGFAFGFGPLQDQQLAGLIMWVPMGAIYMLAALALLGRRLAELERSSSRS